jgi:hypothetical protein
VGKVKKAGRVSDVRRTTKGTKAAGKGSKAKTPKRSATPKRPMSKSKASIRRSSGAGRAGRSAVEPAPRVEYRVRELNPQEKCGAGTSVERLLRVDAITDKVKQAHLIFFDRHGWYCEHGTTCPAVGHARKYAQKVRSPHVGTGTHNGRMRA